MSVSNEPTRASKQDKDSIASTIELFKLVLNRGPAVGWVKDSSGRYIYLNRKFASQMQQSDSTLLSRTDFDWLPAKVAERIKERDDVVISSGALTEFVESLPDTQGDFKEWLVFRFPLKDEEGNSFVGCVASDINDRRMAERRLTTQYSVTRAFTDARSLREVTPKFLQALCGSFSWDVGALWIAQGSNHNLLCLGVWHQDKLSIPKFEETCNEGAVNEDIGLPDQVLACAAPAYLNDISTVSWSKRAQTAASEGLKSAFGYPLRSRNEIIGVIEFYSLASKEVEKDFLSMLDALSSQIAQFIKRKQAEEELEQSNALLQALARAQSQFIAEGRIREVFRQLLRDIMALTRSSFGFISEVEGEATSPQLICHAVAKTKRDHSFSDTESLPPDFIKETLELESHTEGSLVNLLLTSGKPIISLRAGNDAVRTASAAAQASSFLGMPVFLGHRLVGVVGLANRVSGYDENIVHSLKPFLSTCAIILGAHRNNEVRKLAQEALRENESRLSAILDAAADSIITVTENGLIETANRAAERMFMYEGGRLIGRALGILLPSLQSELRNLPSDSHKTSRRDFLNSLQETVGHRRDKSSFPAEISVSEVRLSDQVLYSIIVRDISERKEVEKRVTEFYSTVSHELRTPLTSIRGSLGLIDGGVFGDVSPTIKEYLSIAKANCDRLIGLINDILDIRKIEANKLDLNLEYVLPDELLRASADSIRTIADAKQIRIVRRAQTKRKVHVDTGRIVQILTNLISNAVKFSETGKHVELIAADGENGMVRFSVIDEGPGISEMQLKKLFGKFQQLDSSDTREKGGTGLGLAISKSLVELHHGKIGVASEVGKGSTFWFEVPVRADS